METVELQGSVGAELHLTLRSEVPENLDHFVADLGETENAIASVVFEAQGGANLRHQQTVPAGAGISVGAEAAAQLAFAQHHRVPAAKTGLTALGDLISNLRNPYNIDSLKALTEHELFHVEFSGTGNFSATAGWEWGLVRSFEGTKLARLALAGSRAS